MNTESAFADAIATRDTNPLSRIVPTDSPFEILPRKQMRESERGATRAFERADIPRVAELFLNTFRSARSDRKQDLCDTIASTYLGSPAYSPETGSIVHVDARGCVDGFMGVINVGLRLGERRLTAGVLSAFMADRPDAKPEIGVRLARAAVSLPLDIVFTDTANRTSLDMSRALRFTVLPTRSLQWMKLLRPVGTGVYALARKRPRLRRWLADAAGAIDACLPLVTITAIDRRTLDRTSDRPIAIADFVMKAPRLLPDVGLLPAWDAPELSWLVTQAGLKTRNGPLHLREVLDQAGRCIGLYLLYAERGNIGFALQVLAREGRESQVLGTLIAQAADLGAVAVSGASSPEIAEGLIRQPGVFYRNVMSTVARTSDAEIVAALKSGNARLGGLAGETWARVFGDDFSS